MNMGKSTRWILFTGLSFAASVFGSKSVQEWTYINLDYARQEKTQQLDRFCSSMHDKAIAIRTDELMIDFLESSIACYEITRRSTAPKQMEESIARFRQIAQAHYLKNYISYYDILFVTTDGFIVYTFRKEDDCFSNLLTGSLKNTPLAKQLAQAGTQEQFVDFFYYPASSEPAAFFIEPAVKNNKHLGWFVMQVAINKINSLFAGFEELGTTAETFLVNRSGFLLTESSFTGDATILKTHLDSKNIDSKFREKQGHKAVTDYRNCRALTSFQVFRFLDTEWLIVAKIDEAEVLTHHYREHEKYFYEKLKTAFSMGSDCDEYETATESEQSAIMVDVDEFVKSDHGQILQTVGVSTCTAVIATYPGTFGYLAHISPYDRMYGHDGTNLLGNIVKKIKYYDTCQFERGHVQFHIIATHLTSMPNIIAKLVQEGFLLSQMNVLYNPGARSADVMYDYTADRVCVRWIMQDDRQNSAYKTVDAQNNLGTLLRKHVE